MQQAHQYPQNRPIVNRGSGQRFIGNVNIGGTRVRVCDTFTVMMTWVRLALAERRTA